MERPSAGAGFRNCERRAASWSAARQRRLGLAHAWPGSNARLHRQWAFTRNPRRMIDLTLSPEQRAAQEMAHWFAANRVRPLALEADRTGRYPDEFLRELAAMGSGRGPMSADGDAPKPS